MGESKYGAWNNAEARSILYAGGRGVLVSQWFTNGALGSTWLPGLSSIQDSMATGQLVVYIAYCVLLALMSVAALRRNLCVHAMWGFVGGSIAALGFGDLLVGLAGLGVLGGGAYIVGMCLIGAGMVAPVLSYGEFYCSMGERTTAGCVCASGLVGTCLLVLVCLLGGISPVLAVAMQVACISLAYPSLRMCWKVAEESGRGPSARPESSPKDGAVEARSEAPAALKRLLPFLLMTLLFGVAFGFAIGLNSSQEVSSPIVAWAAGMGGASLIVLFAVWRVDSFNLGVVSRALLPVFLLSAYLAPLAASGASTLVSGVGCAGYLVFGIYYQSCCAALVGTGRVRAMPLFALAVLLDSVGVLLGEFASTAMLARVGVGPQAVYAVNLTVILVVVVIGLFFLGDRETASLWGFKAEETPRQDAERRCLAAAAKCGLTLRETEIMMMLTTGNDPFDIAKELGISVTTVRTHARNIYSKLGIHSQHDLIRTILFDEPAREE